MMVRVSGSRKKSPQHLADGFKFEEGADSLTDLLAVVPGKRNGGDLIFTEPLVEIPDQSEDFLFDPSQVPFVGSLVDDLSLPVDHHGIDADRSCIDADIIVFSHHLLSRRSKGIFFTTESQKTEFLPIRGRYREWARGSSAFGGVVPSHGTVHLLCPEVHTRSKQNYRVSSPESAQILS